MRFDLSDKEWAVIEPLLPPTRQGGGRRDDRQVLDGIFYVLRTGVPWDDVPERYGPVMNTWPPAGRSSIGRPESPEFPPPPRLLEADHFRIRWSH